MTELGGSMNIIGCKELVDIAKQKKADGYRLVQICSVRTNDGYEVTYSFSIEYEMQNYRVIIKTDDEVPSITGAYPSAFLYENEIRELFGVKIEQINVDFKNKLYRIDVETPFKEKDAEVKK